MIIEKGNIFAGKFATIYQMDLTNRNIMDIEKSLNELKASSFDYDIYITLVDEFHNEKTIDELGQWIQGVHHVVLQPFKDCQTTIDHSLHSPNFDQILKYKTILEQYVKHVEIRGNQT